jgi:hypothetical protein
VAKRRRRKRLAAGDEALVALVFGLIAIGLIGSALVWLVSVLLKPLAVIVATVVTLSEQHSCTTGEPSHTPGCAAVRNRGFG